MNRADALGAHMAAALRLAYLEGWRDRDAGSTADAGAAWEASDTYRALRAVPEGDAGATGDRQEGEPERDPHTGALICPECRGAGSLDGIGPPYVSCPRCGGSGDLPEPGART